MFVHVIVYYIYISISVHMRICYIYIYMIYICQQYPIKKSNKCRHVIRLHQSALTGGPTLGPTTRQLPMIRTEELGRRHWVPRAQPSWLAMRCTCVSTP